MGVGAGTALRLRHRRLLASLFACLALASSPATAARLVSATGSQADAYGRIVLSFDVPVAVKAKLSGAVLVLSFGESVTAGPEKIATGLPGYVSVVRRDPDGTGLRLALQRPYRLNLQQAGEQVFVDLLPMSWTGLPPPLPPEVVAELARRAREAEAALRARNPAPIPVSLPLELSVRPARTRLSLKLPPEARSVFKEDETATRLSLPGAWRIDDQGVRGRLKPETGRFTIENGAEGAILEALPAKGFSLVAERDGETITLDFVPKKASAEVAKAQPNAPSAAPTDTPAATSTAAPASEKTAPTPVPDSSRTAEPARRRVGSGLVFPFEKPTPAALFERGGIATLVFETSEPVAMPQTGATGPTPLGDSVRIAGFSVLRLPVPEGRLLDLVPVSEPNGWELVSGDSPVPSESLVAQRNGGSKGRIGIGVKLPDPGGATWLDLDGERIAVVTSRGAKHAGVAKPQRFVDFELLTSRVGVAVLAVADDLAVRPEIDGVAIEREGGVVLSSVAHAAEPAVGAIGDLAIEAAAWDAAKRGDVRNLIREQFDATIGAGRSERSNLRLQLAKTMMANGLDAEAIGVLALASSDDPVLDGEPHTVLLRGILTARLGRTDDAEKLLSSEALARNPEARLWRGLARANAGRWSGADADLLSGESVIERYPVELASQFHLAMAEVASELSDWSVATRRAKRAVEGASALTRDRLTFLRARIDEANGSTTAALEAYDALAAKSERPVQAAAAVRSALLAHVLKKIALPELIDRLELAELMWHGGPTELETLAALGRLYEQAGRWRQVFSTVRRANILAPDATQTRALHERAQALFEDLYLGERADKLGGVESLALYFDFKDFAPIGRRADEIVRRLAERLVALDLLESADELLTHQVEHRLTGPPRASVAARLAAIKLMESKPLDALQVLDKTHLPELPGDIRRARALLRARALSDLTRTDLALETIEGETGADAERLRADILWSSRRWREAGEAHEAILGEVWRGRKPLDETARADVIRAAIAYSLAGETLGQERLKAKFAPAMAESEDARTFALLTRPDAPRNPAFREIARRATSAETLAAFLAEYRKRYPQEALPDRGKAESRVESTKPGNPPG